MHLVLITTSGNQAYIFASVRLREAVGASHLVSQSTTKWVEEASGAVNGRVLQASSGRTLVVVEGAAEARELAHIVTSRALREAPGLVIRAASIEIAGSEPTGDDITKVFQEQGRHAARHPSTATRHQRLPVVAACHSTDAPASSWHSDVQGGVGYLTAESPRPLSAGAIAKRAAQPAAKEALGALWSGHAELEARRPIEVDRFIETVGWSGVVHIDGNQLGAFFRTAADLLDGCPDEDRVDLGQLSEQVQRCAEAAFRDASAALARRIPPPEPLPLVPLIIGGDDLTALVSGEHVLAFTEEYLGSFARHATEMDLIVKVLQKMGRERLTASAGVALVKPNFPFAAAYRLAEQLCRSAKSTGHPDHHGLDVHVLIDSAVTDLQSIRDRYLVDGTSLTERPFLIRSAAAPIPPERDWAEVRKGLVLFNTKGDSVVTSTQLHKLRREVRHDPQRARRRLDDLHHRATSSDDRNLLEVLRREPHGVAPGLLDLLELAPFVTAQPVAAEAT
jgi:hypothetical protein